MPFPPFPQCWIAFSIQNDGTAIEVYPDTQVLIAGKDHVERRLLENNHEATFVHAAIGSPLSKQAILALAGKEHWRARECDRGPFACMEVWIENRLLIEVLDPDMQRDYKTGMTIENWAAMFGLGWAPQNSSHFG